MLPRNAASTPRLLLVSGVCVAVFATMIAAIVSQSRGPSLSDLQRVCRHVDGSAWRELVDGAIVVDFTGSTVNDRKFEQVMSVAAHVSDGWEQSSREIHLILSRTQLGDAALASLGDGVVSCDLTATTVTDNGMKVLAQNCPHLRQLTLADTAVGDSGLKELVSLPIQTLDVSRSNVTTEGLLRFSSNASLFAVTVSEESVAPDKLSDFAAKMGVHVHLSDEFGFTE